MLLVAPIAQPLHAQADCTAETILCCRILPSEPSIDKQRPSFGVQIWPANLSPSALEQLIYLKPRHLRFALGPNWRRLRPLLAGMTAQELEASVADGFNTVRLDTQIDLLRRLKDRIGAKLHLVIWEPPPLGAELRPPPPASRILSSENVPLVARFIVATLKYLDQRGLVLDAVELSNEPDGNWNIRIFPEDYLALVRAVREIAKQQRMTLPKIYGPGTSTIAALREYLKQSDVGRSIIDAVDVVSVHGWDNPGKPDRFVELDGLFQDLFRLGRKPTLAMTEFGLARPVPTDKSENMNVKLRSVDNIGNTPFFAIVNARDLLQFYAKGIGTIISWEFQDQPWGKSSFGLLNQKGDARPIYQTMHLISRQLARDTLDHIQMTSVSGLFVVSQGDHDILWSANVSDAHLHILANNGSSKGYLPSCRDQAGAIDVDVPPWSFLTAPIQRP